MQDLRRYQTWLRRYFPYFLIVFFSITVGTGLTTVSMAIGPFTELPAADKAAPMFGANAVLSVLNVALSLLLLRGHPSALLLLRLLLGGLLLAVVTTAALNAPVSLALVTAGLLSLGFVVSFSRRYREMVDFAVHVRRNGRTTRAADEFLQQRLQTTS